MRGKLVRIGNSRGVRIPKAMIDEAELTDEVEMRVVDGEIRIDETDVVGDGLQRVSYARPDKLFTASASLVMGSVGRIRDEKSRELRRFVRRLFEDGLPAD